MTRTSTIAATLLLTAMSAAAISARAADDPSRSLKDFATDHPDCYEWSDGCSVCVRQDAKTFHCSLPGIACLPKPLACRHGPLINAPLTSPPAPYSAPNPGEETAQ